MSQDIKQRVLDEYDVLAKDYDHRWLTYTQKTLALTLGVLELDAKHALLDIGCGTGQFLEMVEQGYPDAVLHGIEPNLEMLTRAHAKFGKRINCVQAWAHELPFEDASFDVLTCNNMFHYVEEPLEALAEFKRVLRPEGQLILMDWCGDFWTMRLNAWWLDVRQKAHLKTYKASDLRDMLLQSGFNDVWVHQEKIDVFWGMMVARATMNSYTIS